MADDDDNLVLRLLREMRADIHEIRQDTGDTRARVTRIERQMDEMRQDTVMAMGWAGHAATTVESYGDRFDELTDEIAALKRRVSELEKSN